MALAGEFSPALPRPIHERAAVRGTVGSLRSRLPSPPLSSASPLTAGSRLQASTRLPDLSRLTAQTLRAPLYWVREAKFELRSLTSDPHWLCPLGRFDPNFGRSLHRADMGENSDPGERTWMKTATPLNYPGAFQKRLSLNPSVLTTKIPVACVGVLTNLGLALQFSSMPSHGFVAGTRGSLGRNYPLPILQRWHPRALQLPLSLPAP